MAGFTILAVLDEYGDFLGEFRLPFALTDEQVENMSHGSEYRTCETYFWVDENGSLDNEADVDAAQEMIAQTHVVDVKAGLFVED
jgi:hypothetical protein